MADSGPYVTGLVEDGSPHGREVVFDASGSPVPAERLATLLNAASSTGDGERGLSDLLAVEVKCPRCAGTGGIESSDSTEDGWWDCRSCKGTGRRAFADAFPAAAAVVRQRSENPPAASSSSVEGGRDALVGLVDATDPYVVPFETLDEAGVRHLRALMAARARAHDVLAAEPSSSVEGGRVTFGRRAGGKWEEFCHYDSRPFEFSAAELVEAGWEVAEFVRSPPSSVETGGLGELRKLARDWDSYDGLPPSEQALATAATASWVPVPDGGVQWEISAGGAHVEVEIQADGTVADVLVDPSSLAARPVETGDGREYELQVCDGCGAQVYTMAHFKGACENASQRTARVREIPSKEGP